MLSAGEWSCLRYVGPALARKKQCGSGGQQRLHRALACRQMVAVGGVGGRSKQEGSACIEDLNAGK